MKFFKFILVIIFLATSSVWAETISSTIIGGNWSDIETWEDGNVPTESDDVVINGVVSIDSNTVISGIEISRGGTLQKTDGFHTLTVNGDLTNKGNVKDDSNDTDFTIKVSGNINNDLGIFNGEKLFLEVAGDVINKGIWSNNSLRLTSGADSRTISGNTISSNVFFEADFEVINTNFTFSGNVDFSNHIITLPNSNSITFLKDVSDANLIAQNTIIEFNSEENQNISGDLTGTVIFSGSNNKIITSDSTINGSLTIQKGITLQKNSSYQTLTVNGELTNNGQVKDDSSDTDFTIKVSGNVNNELGIFNGEKLFLEVAGDVINKGIWSNNSLRLTSGADSRIISGNTISSNVFFEADFEIINTNFTFSGNVDFANHIIILPNSTSITFLKDVSDANLIAQNTIIEFNSEENQNISGELTGTVILSGSNNKIITSNSTINGSLIIQKGITLQKSSGYQTLTINGGLTNNGQIKDDETDTKFTIEVFGNVINNGTLSGEQLFVEVFRNILNQGTWTNKQTSLTFPKAEFKITDATGVWSKPIFASSYDITALINTIHYWQYRINDQEWSRLRGINDLTFKQLSLSEIKDLTPTNLPEVALQKLSSADVSRVLTNLNVENFQQFDNIKVPEGWQVTDNYKIIPPVNKKVSLKALQLENLPYKVKLPESVPDLKAGFGIGGTGTPVLNGIQIALSGLGNFVPEQKKTGVMTVNSDNFKFAFIPDNNNITQLDSTIKQPALSIGAGGFYQVTTPDSLKIQFIPTPKDPIALSASLNDSTITLGSSGDVFIELSEETNLRRDHERYVVMFDPFIEPAPDAWCVVTDDISICDFDNAPESMQPGIYSNNIRRTRAGLNLPTGKMIYADGTSQTISPTVYSPEIFKQLAAQFEGVEKVIYNSNGTFYVLYMGVEFILVPSFDIQMQTEGESNIAIKDDGRIAYSVPVNNNSNERRDNREVLMFDLFIEPAPESWCIDVEDGEVFCDFDNF